MFSCMSLCYVNAAIDNPLATYTSERATIKLAVEVDITQLPYKYTVPHLTKRVTHTVHIGTQEL